MAIDERAEVMQQFQRHAKDVGSPEVQTALLTRRITGLTQHLIQHKHDNSTRRGLIQLVNKRKRLLRYLSSEDSDRHQKLTSELKITSH